MNTTNHSKRLVSQQAHGNGRIDVCGVSEGLLADGEPPSATCPLGTAHHSWRLTTEDSRQIPDRSLSSSSQQPRSRLRLSVGMNTTNRSKRLVPPASICNERADVCGVSEGLLADGGPPSATWSLAMFRCRDLQRQRF